MRMPTSRLSIAVWGNGAPVLSLLPLLKHGGIDVKYVKVDRKSADNDDFIRVVKGMGYQCYDDTIPNINLDLVFTINYNRIISDELLSRYLFLNYHVGLLPKWRGNSANGWAIINGENEVGYTIHKIVSMLDAGPIYYRFSYPYHEGKTYVEAKTAMEMDFKAKIADIIKGVIINPHGFIDSKQSSFVYCNKFRPIDGHIRDWNVCTDEIIRRLYVFGPPLGTGLKFLFKAKEYEIRAVSRIPSFASSKGVPGGIVYIVNGSMWVKTMDSAISIDELYSDGEKVDPVDTFVIGQRL